MSVQEFAPEVNLDAPPGGVGPFDASGSISGKFESLSGFEGVHTEGTNLGTQFGSVVSGASIDDLFIGGFEVSGGPDVTASLIEGSCNASGRSEWLGHDDGRLHLRVGLPQGPVAPNTSFSKVV